MVVAAGYQVGTRNELTTGCVLAFVRYTVSSHR
jgi:hypothetical protein